MRRFVVALVVAAVALTVAGCGGGGEAEAPVPGAAAPTPAAPAAETAPEYVTDRSATEVDTPPVPFPAFTTTDTPAVFKEKLDANRPMLIFFYDRAQGTTNDVRAEIDSVMTKYRGLIDLVTFDIGGAATDASPQKAVVYATELGVDGTPYIIVVDKGGFITFRWKGFLERGYIGREVERATQ